MGDAREGRIRERPRLAVCPNGEGAGLPGYLVETRFQAMIGWTGPLIKGSPHPLCIVIATAVALLITTAGISAHV